MARKDPMQEQIEQIQRGGEPARPNVPIDPRLPPRPPAFERALIPSQIGRGSAVAGGVFGGLHAREVSPAQKKALLLRLLDTILRR